MNGAKTCGVFNGVVATIGKREQMVSFHVRVPIDPDEGRDGAVRNLAFVVGTPFRDQHYEWISFERIGPCRTTFLGLPLVGHQAARAALRVKPGHVGRVRQRPDAVERTTDVRTVSR